VSQALASPKAVAVFNVFTVEPDNQQRLIDLLASATEVIMSRQPGYLAARIHRSLDGTRVATYAQWRSRADFEAIAGNPDVAAHMRRAQAVATFEPVLYEVAFAHAAAPGRTTDGHG
jgi:heme-degrading monooxygenase HmoA